MKRITLAEAKQFTVPALSEFMEELGLRSITLKLLNHDKGCPVHGIPFVFHLS